MMKAVGAHCGAPLAHGRAPRIAQGKPGTAERAEGTFVDCRLAMVMDEGAVASRARGMAFFVLLQA